MKNNDILQLKLNEIYYYLNEKVLLLWIFEEIHMAKVVFVESARESIVDISGILKKPVYDVSISIKLLVGEKR